MPVARPRQRRNKPAGHSLECRGRGFLRSFPFTRGRRGGGRGTELGLRAPLLASCSWLGWLFPFALSHDPVVESGPHSLAGVRNWCSVTSLGPATFAGALSLVAELALGGVVAPGEEGGMGGRHRCSFPFTRGRGGGGGARNWACGRRCWLAAPGSSGYFRSRFLTTQSSRVGPIRLRAFATGAPSRAWAPPPSLAVVACS